MIAKKRLLFFRFWMLTISLMFLLLGCKENGSDAEDSESVADTDSVTEKGTETTEVASSDSNSDVDSGTVRIGDTENGTDSGSNLDSSTSTNTTLSSDSYVDTEADTDSSTIAGSDTEVNTDMGSDTGSNTDSESAIDSDTNFSTDTVTGDDTGVDSNSDTGNDSESDTDTGVDPNTLCAGGDVWPGDYEIKNVSDRDGLVGFVCVMGDVHVSSSGLSDLSGLENLKYVGGQLDILSNADLISVDGLSGLSHVAGNLFIKSNPLISNLDSLSALTDVGGSVEIVSNPALWKLYGLRSLATIGGNLDLRTLSGVDSLNGGFSALQSVGGSVTIQSIEQLTSLEEFAALDTIGGDLVIQYMPELAALSMRALESVAGMVWIQDTYNLADLDLESLTTIGGDFGYRGVADMVTVSDVLENFSGLSALESVGGDFSVIDAASLTEMILPETFSSAGGITINDNPLLRTIQANGLVTAESLRIKNPLLNTVSLEGLEQVQNQFLIAARMLNSLECDQLTSVGTLNIDDFGQLTDLSPFSNLETITGDLDISRPLPTTAGLEKVTAIGGYVYVYVDSYVGLSNVETIGGRFRVTRGDMQALDEMTRLRTVGGDFVVSNTLSDMDNLQTIAFQSLESIGGYFEIWSNSQLHTISFPSLTTVGDASFSVRNNSLLSNCAVDSIISRLADWSGATCIDYNLVEAACPETTDGC